MAQFITLKSRQDFVNIADKGSRVVMPALMVQYSKNLKGNGEFRVGLTVTKKIGNAVKRNKIKRRLRNAFAEIAKNLDVSGFDYVLVGRNLAAESDYEKIKNDLLAAVKRIKK